MVMYIFKIYFCSHCGLMERSRTPRGQQQLQQLPEAIRQLQEETWALRSEQEEEKEPEAEDDLVVCEEVSEEEPDAELDPRGDWYKIAGSAERICHGTRSALQLQKACDGEKPSSNGCVNLPSATSWTGPRLQLRGQASAAGCPGAAVLQQRRRLGLFSNFAAKHRQQGGSVQRPYCSGMVPSRLGWMGVFYNSIDRRRQQGWPGAQSHELGVFSRVLAMRRQHGGPRQQLCGSGVVPSRVGGLGFFYNFPDRHQQQGGQVQQRCGRGVVLSRLATQWSRNSLATVVLQQPGHPVVTQLD